jgi:hypothetical protein
MMARRMGCPPALRAGLAARVEYIGRQQFAHRVTIVKYERAFLLLFCIRQARFDRDGLSSGERFAVGTSSL